MKPRRNGRPIRARLAVALWWMALLGTTGCTTPCPAMPVPADRCADPIKALPPVAVDTASADAATVRAMLEQDFELPGAAEHVLRALGHVVERGQLRPALAQALRALSASGSSPAHRIDQIDLVHDLIAAQLCVRGFLPRCADLAYRSDDETTAAIRALVASSALPRSRRRLDDPAFVAELEAIQAAPFADADAVIPLLDDARTSIDLATWAIYDDLTGHAALEAFVAAARRGVTVRVLLDGGRAAETPFAVVANALQRAARAHPTLPLEVVLAADPARPFHGQHRKLIVADGARALIGGRNFGDAYSHTNPAEPRRWRDVELLITGPAVAQAEALLARRWPATTASSPRRASRAPPPTPAPRLTPPSSAVRPRVAFVDHHPGDDDPILRSLCKVFDGAIQSIDIENAYVIRMPAVHDALTAAVARGVRVRVLTNSAESLDEPILSYAILRTAAELARAGIEVWLQRDHTLHSKCLLIDDVFAHVGSYNLHPRSHRLEGEVAAHVLDRDVVATLRASFEGALAAARRVTSADDLVLSTDPIGRLAWYLCRDLL